MTPKKAIELLESFQSQIIDGKPTFREIADVIRSLTSTVAAPNASNGETLCISEWLECAAYHEQLAREAHQHEEQWKGYGRKSPHKVEEYTRHERWASMLRQHSNVGDKPRGEL